MKIRTTQERVDKALEKIKQVGTVDGMYFSAKGVKGRYHFDGETLIINLDDKPFLVSWDYVEEQIYNFFK